MGPVITHTAHSGAGSGTGGTIGATDWDAAHTLAGLVQGANYVGGPTSGRYVANLFGASSGTSFALNANDFSLAPFIAPFSFTADRISARGGGTVSGNIKLLAYASGSDGWPSSLMLETSSVAAVSGTVTEYTCSLTFVAGVLYWLGYRVSAATQMIGVTRPGFLVSNSTNNPLSSLPYGLNRSLTYATAATDPFAFTTADVSTNNPPAITLRMS